MFRNIGCTGGIACGKSQVQRMLEARGIPVLDTDRVAHQVMEPGSGVFDRIVQQFGCGILQEGQIHRPSLGRIVFSDEAQLKRLNQLVHPEVARRWRAWQSEQSGLNVVVIPLLFEVGVSEHFDGILCISATEALMRERLRSRGLSEESVEQRMAAQWPVADKMKRSTWNVRNNQSLTHLEQQVEDWLKLIQPEQGNVDV